MDSLRRAALEEARSTDPGEKLRQALELMALGIELQRKKLRAASPEARASDIEARLLSWMSAAR